MGSFPVPAGQVFVFNLILDGKPQEGLWDVCFESIPLAALCKGRRGSEPGRRLPQWAR